MKTIEYKGPILRLAYPEFLRLKSKEPKWRAAGPNYTEVTVTVNPPPHEADTFARVVRHKYPNNRVPLHGTTEEEDETSTSRVVRQGEFRTTGGMTAYEQLIKHVYHGSWIWMVDARIRDRQVLNIRIGVMDEHWYGGRIWEDFVHSIEWIGDTSTPADRRLPTGTKQYAGNVLRLTYPSFLKVKHEEPEWQAEGPEELGLMLFVFVDPEQNSPNLFSRMSHMIDQRQREPSGCTIVREGEFRTSKGIVGREQLTTGTTPLGQTFWCWYIVGKFQGRRNMSIHLTASENYWHDETIWRNLFDSIEVIERTEEEMRQFETRKEDNRQATRTETLNAASSKARGDIGVLAQLPSELHYLIEPALVAGSITEELLDDDPEIINDALDQVLKTEIRSWIQQGSTKQAARARLKEHERVLKGWLEQHSEEEYPETDGLHTVYPELVGTLMYGMKDLLR